MKDKIKFLIIAIAVMVVVIMAGTFAWLSYQSNKTAMVLTIGDINNVQVTLQPYQINANIAPTTTYNSSSNNVVNVQAVNNTSNKKRISLYYDINEIDTDLATEDFKYTITRKTTANGSFSQLKTGDFDDAVAGQPYEILNEKIPETATYEYKVYLWLDGTQTENTEGASFNGELRADINFDNRMKASTSTSLSYVFDSTINRYDVEKVTFLNEIPNNITSVGQPQDISVDGNGNVILYFKDDNNNSKYEMYIAADGQIVPVDLTDFFDQFDNLNEINNLNYLDTSEITDMSYMFYNCQSLISLDVSGLDTSSVTDMFGMFGYCESLTSLDLSSFDTQKLTITGEMFNSCRSLIDIDLSSFDTSNVTDMSNMFYYNDNLTTIYVSDRWNISGVTNSDNMFYHCRNLPNFTTSVTNKTNAHYGTGGYLTYKAYP